MKTFLEVFIVIFLFTLPAKASSEEIISYKLESSDGKYIFVMKGNAGIILDEIKKYPANGLYLNNGSTTPIWTVDWTGYVIMPADGIHIVRMGFNIPSNNVTENALSFFANGKLIKSYCLRGYPISIE